MRPSLTITVPVEVMGPQGEIIATLKPLPGGFAIDFGPEPVRVEINGHPLDPEEFGRGKPPKVTDFHNIVVRLEDTDE